MPAVDEFRPFCSSPTPYSQPSHVNLNKYSDKDKTGSYKKRTAPRAPSSIGNSPPWVKKGPAPPRPISPAARSTKSDPIRELESMGRKISDEVKKLILKVKICYIKFLAC